MAILRFPIAFLVACGITIGLFGFMRALIGVRGEFEAAQAPPKLEFVRLRRDTQVEEIKREKPKQKLQKPAPVTSESTTAKAISETVAAVNLDPTLSADVALEGVQFGKGGIGLGFGPGGGMSDRDAIPLVRGEQMYPERAQAQGIEGWVELEFTISPAGTVKDPRIVGSSSNVFHKAALDAVRRYKYQPKIEDGKAVERTGIRIVLKWSLPK